MEKLGDNDDEKLKHGAGEVGDKIEGSLSDNFRIPGVEIVSLDEISDVKILQTTLLGVLDGKIYLGKDETVLSLVLKKLNEVIGKRADSFPENSGTERRKKAPISNLLTKVLILGSQYHTLIAKDEKLDLGEVAKNKILEIETEVRGIIRNLDRYLK